MDAFRSRGRNESCHHRSGRRMSSGIDGITSFCEFVLSDGFRKNYTELSRLEERDGKGSGCDE